MGTPVGGHHERERSRDVSARWRRSAVVLESDRHEYRRAEIFRRRARGNERSADDSARRVNHHAMGRRRWRLHAGRRRRVRAEVDAAAALSTGVF